MYAVRLLNVPVYSSHLPTLHCRSLSAPARQTISVQFVSLRYDYSKRHTAHAINPASYAASMIDPDLLGLPSLRAALAERDISKVYAILKQHGIPQRQIAIATGQSQSEVSEILAGRRVVGYNVLVRISEGLGIPRGLLGLAYDESVEPAPGEEVGEVDEDMKRRALLAVASAALLGSPVLGEVLELPRPATPTPLPSRIGASDVAAIKNLTHEMRGVARIYGGCAEVLSGVAQRALPLMSIPGSDQTKADLGSALAELHVVAGWCCVDCAHHDNARAHFATAMSLAPHDPAQLASAFRHAGIQMVDAGAWNDSLKSFQLGLVSNTDPETVAWLHAETAAPLAAMGLRDEALVAIKRAREHELTDPFDVADMDFTASCVYQRVGRTEVAEAFAQSAVRHWSEEGTSHRDSVEADIQLASLHVHTGQPDAAALAQRAITSVAPLRSVRARVRLNSLAAALETRPRADHAELARRARQVATTRV